MLLPSSVAVQRFFIEEIQKGFDTRLVNVKERIEILSDVMIFDPGYSIDALRQKKGEVSQHWSIYFDGQFVCGFDEDSDIPESVMLKFWRGLKDLVMKKEVYLDKNGYIIQEELNKQRERAAEEALKKVDTSTPEKKLAQEAAKRIIRRKKNGTKRKNAGRFN